MSDQPLWSGEKLVLSIGRQVIFDEADMYIGAGERVALIGRNGGGKSTLLKIVAGLEKPSSGNISVAKGCRIACMPQDPVFESDKTAGEAVAEGLKYFEELLETYNRQSPHSAAALELEHKINYHQAWTYENKLEAMIDKLGIDPAKPCSQLSGGEMRRVLLARTLISEPDLLLLDEPTNHLDVGTVSWIENFLASYRGACLFVTHDRYFLDRIANRIVELSNGKFFSCVGSYADFLEAKEAHEYAEDAEADKREKFLRLEIDWVRRSPKARLRRNLGRLRRFEELSAIDRPKRMGNVELIIPAPSRLGNKVVELEEVSFGFPGKPLIQDLTCEFPQGSKTGIIGPNGIGKTTLLKLITGSLAPQKGRIHIADTVEFNYIDQTRISLDPESTVAEAVAGDSDSVNLGSDKISIWGYLKRFLFEDERINTKVKYLSGGEKARLLLAIVLKQGGNFLILDEPTNDLDLPTLRVLEEALVHYSAPVIVVSHDRYFLNRVCNRIISFDPADGVVIQEGDYDYFAFKQAQKKASQKVETVPVKKTVPAAPEAPPRQSRKLSYKEQKELDGMEEAVLEKETEISAIEAEFTAPDFYTTRAKDAPILQARLDAAQAELDALYSRWEELENKRASLEG